MKIFIGFFVLILSSIADARTITETSIPYAQICVTRIPGSVPVATLGYQTADSAGTIIDEKTVPASTLFTDQERLTIKSIID